MARHVPAILSKDVVGEEILSVASDARPHRDQEERRTLADRPRRLHRDDLDFSSEGARRFVLLHRLKHFHRALSGLAYGAKAAGPGGARGNEAHMADDRNGVVSQAPHGVEARAAIDGVSGRFVEPKGPAHEVFRAADLIEIVSGHREDSRRSVAKARIEHQVGRHGYDVDAGALRRFQLFERQHAEHRQLALSSDRPHVGDRRPSSRQDPLPIPMTPAATATR